MGSGEENGEEECAVLESVEGVLAQCEGGDDVDGREELELDVPGCCSRSDFVDDGVVSVLLPVSGWRFQ